MSELQDRAFSAYRPRRHHAGDFRGQGAAGSPETIPSRNVFVPCRFRRSGRNHRGCGSARNFRRGWNSLQRGELLHDQPWPYPSSLMIGCTALATNEDIVVDRTELEDARWFDRAEATLMLKRQHPDGLAGPHPFAIAHHLVGRWLQIDLGRKA